MNVEEVKEDEKENKFIRKSISYIIEHKEFFIILLILLLGGVLRYVAANNLEPNADEMVHGPHAKGIIEAGVIGRVWQSITWSYITDVFYSWFGVTMASARATSILFGIASIVLIYLIGIEVFDKKVARLGAFLLAISSFHIISTQIEMDISAVFFVLFGALFFIKSLKKEGGISYLAAVFIGVAALIKTLSLFFLPAFIIFYWIYNKKIFDKKIMLNTIYFVLIVLLIFSPIFIHNYLLYENKNLVDAYLAQYFDIGNSREVYSGIQGINNGFKFNELITGSIQMLKMMFKFDPLVLIFGIGGLILSAYRKEKFAWFFILFQAFAFILITATNRLQTHYAVLPPVLAMYSAFLIYQGIEKYQSKFSVKQIISFILIIFVLINGTIMWKHLESGTAVTKMREFAITNIDDKDVVIADARIYRGRIMWMFVDKHYLESSYLSEIIELNNKIDGVNEGRTVWFIECVPDDCGWGTIKDQPEFNAAVEEMVKFFNERAEIVKEINGGGSPYVEKEAYFKIYKAQIELKSKTIEEIDKTHNFFFYPANYKPVEQAFDYYQVKGFKDKSLFLIAKIIIWASILLAFLSIIWLAYLWGKSLNKV